MDPFKILFLMGKIPRDVIGETLARFRLVALAFGSLGPPYAPVLRVAMVYVVSRLDHGCGAMPPIRFVYLASHLAPAMSKRLEGLPCPLFLVQFSTESLAWSLIFRRVVLVSTDRQFISTREDGVWTLVADTKIHLGWCGVRHGVLLGSGMGGQASCRDVGSPRWHSAGMYETEYRGQLISSAGGGWRAAIAFSQNCHTRVARPRSYPDFLMNTRSVTYETFIGSV